MTCIVGFINGGKVFMGADSAASDSKETVIRKDNKIFFKGKFLIGVSGSFRIMQVIRYGFNPPAIKKGQDIYNYMCTSFISEMRKSLGENGALRIKEDVQELDSNILIAYNGRLFIVEADFQVGEHLEPFNAIGIGGMAAKAAVKAILETGKEIEPREVVQSALSVAAHYNEGVRPPFVIFNT